MIKRQGESNLTVSALTDGAMMAALAALFGIMGIYIPVLGIFTGLVWAIPIMLLVMRHNLKLGIMGLVVAGVLISIFVGPLQGILLIVNLGGMGLVYGYAFKNNISPIKTLFFGTVISALSTVATILLSSLVTNLPVTQWLTDMKLAFDEAINMYEKMGILDKALPPEVTAEEFKNQMFTFMERLLPASLVAASMFSAFINYVIAGKVLKKIGYQISGIPPFREWHFPWYIIWGVIVGLGMLVLGKHYNYEQVVLVGQNILYIYYPILVVSGISVFSYFWKTQKYARIMRFVVFGGLFLVPSAFIILVLLIGLFDPLIDYRRMVSEKKD